MTLSWMLTTLTKWKVKYKVARYKGYAAHICEKKIQNDPFTAIC